MYGKGESFTVSYKEGITIFTPAYNRAKTLVRLYNSLLNQPVDVFEWLIVDDGSTDETRSVVEGFIEHNKINIRYIYKTNGGKHTALNIGMQNAEREYFVCIDSDDYMAENAVQDMMDCIRAFHPDGIIAYKSEEGKTGIIGDEFPKDMKSATLFSLINNYSCSGDRTLIHKTEILYDIHIPEPSDVKFFPETYIYDRFDGKYESVLLRKSICICEYMENGYSANFRMLMINNSTAMKWFYAERLEMDCTFKQRFTFAFRYIGFSLLSKSKEGRYTGKYKWILLPAIPAGIAMYMDYAVYRYRYVKKKQ